MNKHEAIWHACNDGLLLVDATTGCLLDANPSAERLLGRSLANLRTMRYADLHPVAQGSLAERAFGTPGTTVNLDILRPDGTQLPVRFSVSTFMDQDDCVRAIGHFQDNRVYQDTENALVRSNWALSAIRRANSAAFAAESEIEIMRSICESILDDVFVLAWIGLPQSDAARTVAVAAASGCTSYLRDLEISWDDVPSGCGPTGCAIRLGTTQVNHDAMTNPAFAPWAERAREHGIASSIAIPLRHDGKILGAITIYSTQINAFGSDEIVLFEEMARALVFSLDARHALVAATESEQSYRSLFENMRDGIAHCVMHYEKEVPVDFTYLTVNPAFYRLTGLTEVIGQRVSEVIPGLLESNPEIFEKYGNAARMGVVETFETHIQSIGLWLSISVYGTGRDHFIALFDNITERKQAEEKAIFLAHHDPLTQLPNLLNTREQFEQVKKYSLLKRTKVAFLFLDIDHFKVINDTLGHNVGDLLLQQVAIRLHECVRTTDTVSRQGGDEFLIILPITNNLEDITTVSVKILKILSAPFLIGDRELSSSASLGVAVFPDDGDDFDTLLRKADTAMYHAKESGRNGIRFFDRQMNVHAEDRLTLRNALRVALERGEFLLHYQPQIDMHSGLVVGAEALLRWNHPTLGAIPPGRFISIAEESGLIVPIGEWVLHEACRQAMAWRRAGLPDMVIAANLSAVQFRQSGLEKSVIAALTTSGLAPWLLELELTESVLIGDTESVLLTMQHLKSFGIKLSIDDFGTGYSSLAYLKRFAVDKLKIDQSFVRGLENNQSDEAIVRSIIQMAHSLGLKTIAEGVEDEPVQKLLHALQCDEAQGYHIAHPLSAEDFFTFANLRMYRPKIK